MELLGTNLVNPFKREITKDTTKPPAKGVVPPAGNRVSHPDFEKSFSGMKDAVAFVKPDFAYEYIPVIRKLLSINSSVSLATSSIVQLANTGFKIEFDKGVSDEQAVKMRTHLDTVTKTWGAGLPGLHGLINKLIYQLYIGGAVSTEWVLKQDLSGIGYLAFIKPETIRMTFDYVTNLYSYYQKVEEVLPFKIKKGGAYDLSNYVPLNPITYQYYGFVGDTESPVGIPPFLSALDDLQSQLKMLRNIGFVSDQLGIMGFLEILMAKPDAREGEGDIQYEARLEGLLTQAKENIKDGVKDGIVSGYIDDHEFNFHSSTKDTAGVADIFDINQRMVSNGLFTSPQFLGGSIGGTESLMTVVFTKMLSQLTDVQAFVAAVIERGLKFELLMAGYSFETVKLTFNQSTITDEVKYQQGREIKQRIAHNLYADGIISLPQYAWEMGYEDADEDEPRLPVEPQEPVDDMGDPNAAKKKEQKNQSARRTRDKDKPQPKRNDRSTKSR